MKAFVLTAADQPAAIVELPTPQVAPHQVLIRVHAASVNGFDVFEAQGALAAMMPHEYPVVIGRDFSGVVEAVGAERSDVKVGDAVLGFVPAAPPLHDGSFAEVIAAGPDYPLVRKPDVISFEQAAAIPLAGMAALVAVDAVAPAPGDTVLLVGATGGVGSIALQLAAQRGATVIATARPGAEHRHVLELGASEVIDYTAGDVAGAVRARYPDGVSTLIDLVNRGDDFAELSALVRDGGAISTTLSTADVEGLSARRVRATNVMGFPTTESLIRLVELVASGSLRIEIQGTYPLDETAKALAAFAAGTLGKLVVTVA